MPEDEKATYEAAARLVREAQARAEQAARVAAEQVPPNGWRAPGDAPPPRRPPLDLGALAQLLGAAAHGTLPPELARQLADALRELLLALRAIIDHAIERLEAPARDAQTMEDIPIR